MNFDDQNNEINCGNSYSENDSEMESQVSEAVPAYDNRFIDPNKLYTYADFATWEDSDYWELFDGVPIKMATPTLRHQDICVNLVAVIHKYLKGKPCKVYNVAVDFRLNAKTFDNNVFHPDLIIICDFDNIDKEGYCGTPEMVVEVLSPSTAKRDKTVKLNAYQKKGVEEYWIIDPKQNTVVVYVLSEDKYIAYPYKETDIVKLQKFKDCVIDLSEVFE